MKFWWQHMNCTLDRQGALQGFLTRQTLSIYVTFFVFSCSTTLLQKRFQKRSFYTSWTEPCTRANTLSPACEFNAFWKRLASSALVQLASSELVQLASSELVQLASSALVLARQQQLQQLQVSLSLRRAWKLHLSVQVLLWANASQENASQGNASQANAWLQAISSQAWTHACAYQALEQLRCSQRLWPSGHRFWCQGWYLKRWGCQPNISLPKGKEQESKTTELLREILFSILVFFPFSFFDLCLCIVLFSYLSSQSFVAFGFLRIVGVFCWLLVYSLILVFSLITCCIVRKVMSFICSFSRLVIGVVMFMSMFM